MTRLKSDVTVSSMKERAYSDKNHFGAFYLSDGRTEGYEGRNVVIRQVCL